jgi:hypothetical protein
MVLVRSRFLWIGIALLLFLHPGTPAFAGCHTDCSLNSPFGSCLNCGFRAFSEVTCYRSSCDACDTLSCEASLPSTNDQWASGISSGSCSAPATPVAKVRIVKVQHPAARG